MGRLLVVTGPPGAGKSTVARLLADQDSRSVLVEGDAFFRFLASGRIEPWLAGSHNQNTTVTRAAASAAGRFVAGGYATVFDGVVGPWLLPTFLEATGLEQLDYVILLPPVEVCVQRMADRLGHGFTDERATRKMYAEFEGAQVDRRHVVTDARSGSRDVARRIQSALGRGELAFLS